MKTFGLIFLLLTSCAPQMAKKNSRPLVTGSWLKKQRALQRQERLPAALSAPRDDKMTCFDERFTTSEVKSEALQYEARLSGEEKVVGRWNHLDLETLPAPQAHFLQAIGDKLGDLSHPNALSYNHCRDAVCVVNAVYQSSDGLEGWATYLWYLKMGGLLTFKNEVFKQKDPRPGVYNQKNYELKDYLFSRDELQVFWHISHEINSRLRHLPGLKEIQRLPRTSTMEGENKTICGQAYTLDRKGYIVLGDKCLEMNAEEKGRSFMYLMVTHELGHHLDWKLGRESSPKDPWYSHFDPWTRESQWTLKEHKDPISEKVVQVWTSGLREDQFVRSYAAQSPSEQFADTLAYYRYEGQLTKQKTPPTVYEHLRQKFYDQAEYNSEGQLTELAKTLLPKITPEFLKLKAHCQEGSLNKEACFKRGVDELFNRSVKDLKYNHPDGCRVLNQSEQQASFRRHMEQFFSSSFNEENNLASTTPQELKRLDNYYTQLEESSAPLTAIADCRAAQDEKACYEERLRLFTEESLPQAAPSQPGNLYGLLAKNYLETHSYQEAQLDQEQLYRSFVFSQSNLIHAKAQALWETCKAISPNDSEAPVAGAFSVGEKWMVSSQFNCLNNELPTQVKRLITEMTFESMAVADEKEAAILYEMSLPEVVQELSTFYEEALLEEKARVSLIERELRPQHIKRLTSSLTWVKRLGPTHIVKSCGNEMRRDFPRDLRYHNPEEAFAPYTAGVCTEVLNSKAYKAWMKKNSKTPSQTRK